MNTTHKRILALLVLSLILNLPVISALQISNVRVEDITPTSATIKWDTDTPADGFVRYGTSAESRTTVGDADAVQSHSISLRNLQQQQSYVYSVQSAEVIDDNAGSLYSFSTPAPDTEAPILLVNLSSHIQGNRAVISGQSESQARITIFVNGEVGGSTIADANGLFTITNIFLVQNTINAIKVEAKDAAGNVQTIEGTMFADTAKPVITHSDIPELVAERSIALSGTVSENSTITITLNSREIEQQEGMAFEIDLDLNEGKNNLTISAVDQAGWEERQDFVIESDTTRPQVSFELVQGTEYYQGIDAETDITGETEAGATLYLYVFRQGIDDYRSSLKRAIAKTTAGENGKFTFSEVSFPPPPFTSIQELAPREVPPGLLDVLTPLRDQLGNNQDQSYQVIIIAEDKTGKSDYAQRTLTLRSCFSAEQDFHIIPLPQFQAPFRLDPGMMEDGREIIQAVFNLTYRGDGVATVNPATNQILPGYRISNVRFQKACTRALSEGEDYGVGCKLLPSSMTVQPNQDKTAFYVTANLMPANEFLEKEDNPWEDFKHRQLKFPLKILITYEELQSTGSWSEAKTQVACQDMGYFVDIPIESEDLVPDVLANQGVAAINYTINQIETVKPYLQTVMIASGVGCVSSFLTKMAVRFYRIFIGGFEPWLTRNEGDDKKCLIPSQQHTLPLKETREQMLELQGKTFKNSQDTARAASIIVPDEKDTLEERCPQTAGAWKVEAFFDKFYKYTCDRFLCRTVPARWTEDKQESDVQNVLNEQLQCTATSNGEYLEVVENCQDTLKKSPAYSEKSKEITLELDQESFECYRNANGELYYIANVEKDVSLKPLEQKRIYKLKPAASTYKLGDIPRTELFAFKPEGSSKFMVGKEQTCANVCDDINSYIPARDGMPINGGSGCYIQDEQDKLKNRDEQIIRTPKIPAGYTKDCFIDKRNPQSGLYQCVCEPGEVARKKPGQAREALPKEKWIYRDAKLYEESNHFFGTNYPSWRYYDGRDFSASWGLNYALDYLNPSNPTTVEVNPHTQYTSTFQSACFPGIWARLNMLENILIGVRDCILRAKYTGEFDVGMCKTLFTQYVCGMIYKGIAYLGSQCSPLSIYDFGKGTQDPSDGGVQAFVDSGFKAIPETIEKSINEVKSDYNNANVNQFFSTGSQGFAESLCLAAFGYDFPMGMDFIQDTAYAFPTATVMAFPIAERELTTFNPIQGTPTFNYNLGGSILPGCQIAGYRTYLKCIGPEDLGHPNVECTNNGCDCLNAGQQQSPYDGERTYSIEGGTGFSGLTKGQPFSLPIPSPQRVSSHFRYDHVILELTLGPGENPEVCFDDGYRTSNGGIYYVPITEVKTPVLAQCFVDVPTGRFVCPQISSLFGGGSTYIEHPYVQCYDKTTQDFVDCQTPNLFLINDPVVIRPSLNLAGQKACLKISDTSGSIQQTIPLPENQQGPFSPKLEIATVTDSMITGGGIGTILRNADSDPGCGSNSGDVNIVSRPSITATIPAQRMEFKYFPQPNGKYVLQVLGTTVTPTGGYSINGNELTLSGTRELTLAEINAAIFSASGFTFSGVLGSPTPSTPPNGQCVYSTQPPRGGGVAANMGTISVTVELLAPGPGDNCYTATSPLPRPAFGTNRWVQSIRVQAQPIEVAVAATIHDDFIKGNYNVVIGKVQGVVNRKDGSLDEATAIYYWIASYIAKDSGVTTSKSQIISLLDLFFKRTSTGTGTPPAPFSNTVTSSIEYQKINAYLCEVAKKVSYITPAGKCLS